ncbi:MAG: RNA 2',3'-cyclic phosphodiesterase [Bacteroidia bacterium]|nr:RNA 2',3'-cyclic phosphodiesterase [Bacteroidia bacterium]
MRLFVALPIPPEAVGWIMQYRPPILPAGAYWTNPYHWHLTLAFLGEQEEALVPEIHRRLEPILQGHPAQSLRPLYIGWVRYTLWVHLEPEPTLESLVKLIHKALNLEFRAPFRPHITIARSRRLLQWQSPPISERPLFSFTTAHLCESILRPSGAEYRTIQRYLFRIDPQPV